MTLRLGFLASLCGVFGTLAPASSADTIMHLGREWPAPKGFEGVCQSYPPICQKSPHPHQITDADWKEIKKVNQSVNQKTPEVSDESQYHVLEKWALPSHLGGDCEDIAMLKKVELQKMGISPDHLLLVTVLDLHREGHAVLVVRTSKGDYVLDNLTNRVLPWNKTHYAFIEAQDPNDPARWDIVLQDR
ncbi:transglutaminase-like cysteine peptidase [Ruegeria arenilitoris]|uniref:transglutaminase-like cysteine peptidase n=1 Tax=Ruegeria arenilitoris TaxID=1173585 RepID=UPI0014805C4A|nr:transglutaminase-like cysteine peptidase [Ruegeria arenilitoris]